jgi:hypothetical protein
LAVGHAAMLGGSPLGGKIDGSEHDSRFRLGRLALLG